MKAWIALLALVPAMATAQLLPPERVGRPDETVIATSKQIAPTLQRAAKAFEAANPGQHVRIEARGSDVAMTLLYTYRADIAVIGRDGADQELKAYEWIYLKPPVKRAVMRGSVATPEYSPSIAVRVNAANPLRSITMAQLASLFRPAKSEPTWASLGVGGKLASQPVRIAVPKLDTGTGRFVRHAILADATQVAWQRVVEPDAAVIARTVAGNLAMIGIGDASPLAGTRIVPVVQDGMPVLPQADNYPLTRNVMAYAHPGAKRSEAFLAFLTGEAGRAAIAPGPYRPVAGH
ncbi:MAG: substrate-binding domain-containing protein [Pseudomonadota bacterium]